MSDERPKRKRRWLQFRLSTIALLVFLVAVGLSAYRRYVAYQALDVITQKAEYVRPYPRAKGIWRLFDDSIYDVHHLSFHGRGFVTDEDVAQVAKLSGLRRLSLHRTSTTDEIASAVGELKSLEALSFEGTQITDAGVAQLVGLKNLRSLSLRHTVITDAALESLSQMESLEELRVGYTRVSAAGMAHLAKLKSLRFLGVTRPSQTMMDEISKLSQLERLRANSGQLQLDKLRQLTNLRELEIGGQLPVVRLAEAFPRLQSLRLYSPGDVDLVGHPTLEKLFLTIGQPTRPVVLSGIPNLESAEINHRGPPMEVEVLDVPSLKKLVVKYSTLTLRDAPKLEYLEVHAGHRKKNGEHLDMHLLGPLPRLKTVYATAVHVTEVAARRLSDCELMESLNVRQTTGHAISVDRMSKLKDLRISYRSFAARDLQLTEDSPLRTLDLDYASVSDTDLEKIRWPRGLKRLSLTGNMITDRGVESIESLPNLEYLGLSGNPISGKRVDELIRFPRIRNVVLNEYARTPLVHGSGYGAGMNVELLNTLGWAARDDMTVNAAGLNFKPDVTVKAGRWVMYFRRSDLLADRE